MRPSAHPASCAGRTERGRVEDFHHSYKKRPESEHEGCGKRAKSQVLEERREHVQSKLKKGKKNWRVRVKTKTGEQNRRERRAKKTAEKGLIGGKGVLAENCLSGGVRGKAEDDRPSAPKSLWPTKDRQSKD